MKLHFSVGRLLAVAALATVPLTTGLAQKSEHAFVFLLGADTLGIERITSMPGGATGVIQMRGQPRVEWDLAVPKPGYTSNVALRAFRSAEMDAPLLQRATIRYAGDSALVEISGASGAPLMQRLAARADAIMLINGSVAGLEMIMSRATGSTSAVPVFLTTGGRVIDVAVKRSGDSAVVSLAGMDYAISMRGGQVESVLLARQNLRMMRVEGSALAGLSLGKPDYSAPAGAPYTATDVSIPAGAHTLAATLTRPTSGAARVPVVVTITGSGPQDRDSYLPIVPGFRPFRQLADTLGRRGVAVLRYDERGAGASSGSYQGSTSADFADDVMTVVAWARKQPGIDPDKVFLAGHSEGGMIAPMVAARDPRLAGIVLLAGTGKNGREILNFQIKNLQAQDSSLSTAAQRDSARKAAAAAVAELEKDPWMRFFFQHDPVATAQKVRVPVLIVQGATDQQVTPEQAPILTRAFKSGGNRDVTELIVPEINHLLIHDPSGSPLGYGKLTSGRVSPAVFGPVVEWIVTHGAR